MRCTKYLAWPMAILASTLAIGHSRAQDSGQVKDGLALAQQVCGRCHAIDKSGTSSPNPAAPRFEVIANTPGMTALALTVALRTPHREMPNLILEADEIRNVAAYIL